MATYDLTVIGAGPSGTACAYHAAQRGLRVLVLDARRLPRAKLCSGVLTAYGETEALSILSPAQLDQVTTGRFDQTALGSGAVLTHRRIRLVDRARFDLALAEAAVAAGAVVQDGTRVDVADPATKLVVDATGSAALFGRHVQHRQTLHFGVEAFVPAETTRCGLDFGLAGGYWWTFPHEGYTAIGGITTRRALWTGLPDAAAARWHARGLPLAERPRGHMLRRAWGPVSRPGLMLVGEAAGALDQALGEGIRFALWTGRIAAEAAVLGPARGSAAYASAYRRQAARALAVRDAAAVLRAHLPCEVALTGPLGRSILQYYLGDDVRRSHKAS